MLTPRVYFKSVIINYFGHLLFVFLFSIILNYQCHASDFQSPRTMALGGASHAAPLLNDSIFLNPSFSSFLPTYSIAFNYGWYNGGTTNPDGSNSYHGHILNGSIQDGRSEMFQAGVSFTRREDARFFHFGASKAMLRNLGVGVGGKWVVLNDSANTSFQDLTLAATFFPEPWLQTALIVDNLLETQKGLALNLHREIILASKWSVLGSVMFYFDPHLFPNLSGSSSFGHELGIEIPVMSDVYLRMGNFRNAQVFYEGAYGRGYAFGIGWVAPKISFDYAVQRAIDPIGATFHQLGMTVYF